VLGLRYDKFDMDFTDRRGEGVSIDTSDDLLSPRGGLIYKPADMFDDPHFRARGLFEAFAVNGKTLEIPALLPRLADTPGRTDWTGPALGSHNAEIFGGLLRLTEAQQQQLRRDGVI